MPSIAPTAHEMLSLRRDTERTFDKTVEVWHPTLTPASGGGQATTIARQSSGPGRIAPLSNQQVAGVESMYADRLGGRQPYVITVGHDRSLTLTDQLRVDARSFEVVSIDAPRSFSADRRVIAVELT